MSILPFGCRAHDVKPRPAYSKTRMDSQAWVGINVGRSRLSPGAYNVWVPSKVNIVTSSDVYFDKLCYSWRRDTASPSIAQASDSDPSQPPGLHPAHHAPAGTPLEFSGPFSLLPPTSSCTRARRALLLFSGPIQRRDGVASLIPRPHGLRRRLH
eukprot:6179602-Pleurochrysis_carterae.AAC.1